MTTTSPTRPQAGAPASPPPAPKQPRKPLRTPGKMILAIVASVTCSLFIAGFGLWLGLHQASLLGSAADGSEEVVSLFGVETDLTLANATTTNAFLVGGLEPSDLRLAADESFYNGARGLASHAAEHGGLSRASGDLALYAGLIEQARAANRQGFPVGAAYLDQATTMLTEQIQPEIDGAVVRTSEGVANDLNQAGGQAWVALVLVAPLAGLIGTQVWLSRQVRRRYNVPFTIGTVLVVLAGIGLAGALNSSGSGAERIRESRYVPTLAAAQALSDAAQARSDEAFTLIRRGSGAAYEESFQNNLFSARTQLDRGARAAGTGVFTGLTTSLSEWEAGHAEIRALDDGGDWDSAVALATTREAGSPSALYQAFADDAWETVRSLGHDTAGELEDQRAGPIIAGGLIALAGIACAALSARGLSNRLKEYR
ncbi:hypothetical protein [Salana multivorans]